VIWPDDRVLDHDTYSAHDAIGRVYIDLNPLLIRRKDNIISGWYPIYDTMHGTVFPYHWFCGHFTGFVSSLSTTVKLSDCIMALFIESLCICALILSSICCLSLGIRGQLHVIVKVDLFTDSNKFRQSSCGVRFFCSKSFSALCLYSKNP